MTWASENLGVDDVIAHIDEQIRQGDKYSETLTRTRQELARTVTPPRLVDSSQVRDGLIAYDVPPVNRDLVDRIARWSEMLNDRLRPRD